MLVYHCERTDTDDKAFKLDTTMPPTARDTTKLQNPVLQRTVGVNGCDSKQGGSGPLQQEHQK